MSFLIGGVICLAGMLNLAVAGESIYRRRIYDHYHLRDRRCFLRSRDPLQYWVRTVWFGVVGCVAMNFGLWMILSSPAFKTAPSGFIPTRQAPWEWTSQTWVLFLIVLLAAFGVSYFWQWLVKRDRCIRAAQRKARKTAAQGTGRQGKSEA
jgi:drug/metabolite transporter (DMT)-like permease